MEHAIIDACPNNLTGVSAHLFLTLINTLMAAKCNIQKPDDYPQDYGPQLSDNDEFDFIVVGAGSAGSVVATKISENEKWNVLVLEAGGIPSTTSEIPSLLFSLQGTPEDWQYSTEPSQNSCLGLKDQKCKWPRGKALGGSSTINAMIYARGNRKDYDQWSELGNPGWDYDNVLKTFQKLENLQAPELEGSTRYGRNGNLPLSRYDSGEPIKESIKEAGLELGYPTTLEEEPLSYFETLSTTKKGLRQNTGKAFLGKVRDRKNLKVALNAYVHKILIDQNNKQATGVEVNIGGKMLTLKANKEVILSAGAINSPQVLMLSGIGPTNHLKELGIEPLQDLRVGENLQDHLVFPGFFMKVNTSATKLKHPYHVIDQLYKYFMYQIEEMSQISITNLISFVNTKGNSKYPNLLFHHVLHVANDPYLLPEILRCLGTTDEVTLTHLEANEEGPTANFYPIVVNPKSRGKILLKSTNPLDKPLIYANYLSDEGDEDLQTLLEGVRFSEKMMETKSFQKHNPQLIDLKLPNCKNLKFRSNDYWKCAIRNLASTLYHPVGTCKMGPKSDKEAVVDSRLRVHGVKGLRVIDASIMPNIVSANTNGPSIMIGLKGGEMISEDWLDNAHEEL